MNRIQEIPWKDKISPAQAGKVYPFSFLFRDRLNLYQIGWIKKILVNRWPQLVVRLLLLAAFVFTIAAGLFGSQVGSHNFAIIFIWIAWWTALKLVFIPLGGRSWCSVCPIPLPGEWLQQRGIFEKSAQRSGFGRRWPRKLKGSWLQSLAFLSIGLFSAFILTDARLTAWILLGMMVAAAVFSLVFEKRAFCTHLCPVGGFSGLYARTAPLELRVIDTSICASHKEKTCYQQCSWGLYPVALRDSSQCGLCMECLRACPQENLALNIRPFGSDLETTKSNLRLDEAFLALVMLGAVLAFSAVYTGPWGALKMAAFSLGSTSWFSYSLALLALNLIILPGLFSLAVYTGIRWSGNKTSFKNALTSRSQALLPLGLFAWIAFTVSFAFPKFNTILSVLSDPMGWGWDLFGTARASWAPDAAGFISILPAVFIAIGLYFSTGTLIKTSKTGGKADLRQAIPVLVFCLAFALAMLWLLVG